MERLTNRNKEIPLPNTDNAQFWARVHEKLARYEDAEEQAYTESRPKTYCEKWPTGCMFCDLLLCDGKKENAEKRCNPCKPTQPECGECEFAKPVTNADRIRAMTDEELAEWLSRHLAVRQEYEENRKRSVAWLDWLKQEAVE